MYRRWVFGFVLIAAWAVLFGWASSVPWLGPLSPRERINLAGESFRVVMGAGVQDGSALDINAVGDDDNALQSIPLEHVRAMDFPILRYRFADFPRTLELTLVFRRADMPDDVQTISLPWPGADTASFDLSKIPQWQGEILEIGFAEYPTPQLVPPGTGFHPFRLDAAELWSPSWHGALAALMTDWFGNWPWSQRSVHALGRDTDTPRACSLTLLLALGIGVTLGLGVIVLRWRSTHLGRWCIILTSLAWLTLDLRWQTSLSWKHATTRALYANRPESERMRMIADVAELTAAERVRNLLRAWPENTRVLVQAGSPYELLRLLYHLLPLNASALPWAFADASGAQIPEGCFLVFYNTPDWIFDTTSGHVESHGASFPVIQELEDGPLRVYRYAGQP